MPFKMHKIIFFPEKKWFKKMPYLNFLDLLPETLIFLFGLTMESSCEVKSVHILIELICICTILTGHRNLRKLCAQLA